MQDQETSGSKLITRRCFIATGSLAIGGLILPSSLMAAPKNKSFIVKKHIPQNEKKIYLLNANTGEIFKNAFFADGNYVNMNEINYLFRDQYSNASFAIDTRLLEYIYSLNSKLLNSKPIRVISGYRCPSTNAMLRRHSAKVAKKSYHMTGQAADFRIEGRSVKDIVKVARALKYGGVGAYYASNFVHIDTGPLRVW